MNVTMLRGKIHLAKVTTARFDYVGSIEIDPDLMDAAGMIPNERVLVANVTTGARFETYTIEAPRGSGEVGVNGAAAHLAKEGDTVIVFAWASMELEEARSFRPRVVLIGEGNKVAEILS